MSTSTKPQYLWQRIRLITISVLLLYLVTAYLLVPTLWKDYTRYHPALEDTPGLTSTADGIPGDPLDVAIIGTKAEAIRVMLAAQWHPADPLSLRSCLEIVAATTYQLN